MCRSGRLVFGILTVLLVALVLGPVASFRVLAAQPTVVTVWSWRTQDNALWKAVQDKLDAMGENIKIEHRAITATQYDAVLSTAMQGGQGPDIITSRAGSTVASYAAAGQYEPLTGKVNLSAFNPGVLQQVSYKGVAYAVPFAIQTLHVYYNKDIYKKLGLQVPQTWDEFIKNLKTIKSAGYIPLFVSGREAWTLPLIVEAIGATWLGNDWTKKAVDRKTNFTDPKFVEVLQRIKDLEPYFQSNATASNYNDMNVAFTTGMAAHVIDGIWSHATYQQANPKLNFGTFLIPGPTKSVRPQVYSFVDGGYALNAASKVKPAALKVLNLMASVAGGQIFVDTTHEPSAVPGVTVPGGDVLLKQALQEYASQAVSPIFGIRSAFDMPPVSSQQKNVAAYQGINSLLMDAVQGMLVGKLTPEAAAKRVNDGLSWYFKK